MDGPPGKYRFLATFLEGAAAAGGEVEFYVTDRAQCHRWRPRSCSVATIRNCWPGSRITTSARDR